MPIDINFGAIQNANPFAAYQQGQEIGQKNRQQAARQEAGNVFSTDPNKAADILMQAGDYEAGLTLRKYGKEQEMERQRQGVVGKYAAGDVAGAQTAALATGDLDLVKTISSLSTEQRAIAKANSEDLGGYAQTLLGAVQNGQMTPQDAKAHILQDKPHLLQLGLTAEQIDNFDPTPQNLQVLVSKGMDLKMALEQADKAADNHRADAQLDETRRSNRTREGISRGQLSVAQGNLGVRRQEFGARKAAGGFGTPGAGKVLGPELDPNDGW